MIDIENSALKTTDGELMSLESAKAIGTLEGLLLNMRIQQKYKNKTSKTLEVVYTFPLAWSATFLGLNLEINGKKLHGVVTEKESALKKYEKAIQDGDMPIMLEKNSDGIYTVNIGNLKPNEEILIEYNYAQLLKLEEGSVRLSIPTTIAPRYGNSEKGGIQQHQTVENDFFVEYPFGLSLTLTGGIEKASIESPSHIVEVKQIENAATINLTRQGYLDRDFVLNLKNVTNQSYYIVTPDKRLGPDGCTVLASFCLPENKQAQLPVNLKILVDCSGSMEGDSINSAKKALHHVLSSLTSNDKFSYSKFGYEVSHEFKSLKNVNQINIAAANLFIANTEANMGGTEIEGALLSTFLLTEKNEKADLLLITDGEVWDTDSIIDEAKISGHRIFAIGVGTSPAESLLQELAEKTGGACELISPNEDIETAIIRMFNRIRMPRAADIEINWGAKEEPLWISGNNRAIFSGNTTHVFAGFTSLPTKPAYLSFTTDKSRDRIGVSARSITTSESDQLARLGAYSRFKNLSGKDRINLAIDYQLITENTNYILVQARCAEEKSTDLPELQKIAQMQAAGWGGAGSAQDQPTAQRSIKAFCAPSMMNSMSYAQYDIPKVFRSSNSSSSTLNANDLNSFDEYEIPHFLRKQADEDLSIPLSPQQVIDIANFEIDEAEDFDEFIKAINSQKLDKELVKIIKNLNKFLSDKDAWLVILYWLSIQFEDDTDWNELTRTSIEQLGNNLKPDDLAKGLSYLNGELTTVNIRYW